MRRKAKLLAAPTLLAFAIAASTPILAQEDSGTGIDLVLADWLDPWEDGGGWMALPAGGTFGKGTNLISEMAADLAPGTYDVYWVQSVDADPLPIAMDVGVMAGERAELRVTTGIELALADWVTPRDPDDGVFGVLLPETLDFTFYAQSATADTLYLPPGDYLAYYHPGGDDGRSPTYIGGARVEAPFGGLGIEIAVEDSRIVIVQTLPGGAAEAAGVEAGDVVVNVDGTELTGLEIEEAAALLRGDPETVAMLNVLRGKESLTIEVERTTVEPHRTVAAASGIQLVVEVGIFAPDGWWGVVYSGNAVESFDDLVQWEIGTNGGPMLLGPTTYDIYWNPDGIGAPELIEANVELDGELIEIVADSPN